MRKRQGQAFLCDQLGGQERANCYAQQLSLEPVQRWSQGTQDREATTTHLAGGLAGGSEKVAGGLSSLSPPLPTLQVIRLTLLML